MRCHLPIICLPIICLLAVVGCGKDPHDRQGLSGTVTLAGQPLEEGSIQFLPTESGSLWRAGAVIEDGKYLIPRLQGLPPGSYRVVISSPVEPKEADLKPEQLFEKLKKEQGEIEPGKKDQLKKDQVKKDQPRKVPAQPALPKDRVPAAFNGASTQKVEVRSGVENIFDFAIP